MTLAERIEQTLITIPHFPRPGILFKDVTPLFQHPELYHDIIQAAAELIKPLNVQAIAGMESRGFPLGFAIAAQLNLPFVFIRKQGKLPRPTFQVEYDLEYGTAVMELQQNDIQPHQRVYIHDDLLATGGTALAAAKLVEVAGGQVVGFGFIVTLDSLNGQEKIKPFGVPIHTFASLQE
jgi:adenine phosphoribosyltransferase